jgi:hypothetical protein
VDQSSRPRAVSATRSGCAMRSAAKLDAAQTNEAQRLARERWNKD